MKTVTTKLNVELCVDEGELLSTTEFRHVVGAKVYEVTNHLGNVLATVSDRRERTLDGNGVVSGFGAVIKSTSDYWPFGSELEGRQFDANRYKFGFGGQEADQEIAGDKSMYTAQFWEYDAKIGRRWNVDPMFGSYSHQSTYAAFNNNPIYYSDPLGLEGDGKDNAPGNDNKKVGDPNITQGSYVLGEINIVGEKSPVSKGISRAKGNSWNFMDAIGGKLSELERRIQGHSTYDQNSGLHMYAKNGQGYENAKAGANSPAVMLETGYLINALGGLKSGNSTSLLRKSKDIIDGATKVVETIESGEIEYKSMQGPSNENKVQTKQNNMVKEASKDLDFMYGDNFKMQKHVSGEATSPEGMISLYTDKKGIERRVQTLQDKKGNLTFKVLKPIKK